MSVPSLGIIWCMKSILRFMSHHHSAYYANIVEIRRICRQGAIVSFNCFLRPRKYPRDVEYVKTSVGLGRVINDMGQLDWVNVLCSV